MSCENHLARLLDAVPGYRYSGRVENDVGVLVEQTEGCIALTGYRPEEFLADPNLWLRTIHPEDRDRVWQHAARLFDAEELPPIEYRIVHRDLTTRWVRNTVVRRYDESGKLIGYDGLVEDITAQRQAEEQARYHRAFAEALIETSESLVLVLDTLGVILRFTPRAERITGFDMHEAIGHDCFSLLVPEPDRLAMRLMFNQVTKEQRAVEGTHPLVTKEGEIRQIHWVGKTVRDERNTPLYVLLAGHDVTQRKQAERSAHQHGAAALLGWAALRWADQQQQQLARLRKELETIAAGHCRSATRNESLQKLADALQDWEQVVARIGEYRTPIDLRWQTCRLDELLARAWQQARDHRPEHRAELKVEPGSVALQCEASPTHLQQALSLLLEALLAICPEPAVITARWSEGQIADGPALQLALHHNGPNVRIDPKELLQAGAQVAPTEFALNLAIASRLVQAQGGTLRTAQSSVEGNVLVLTMPREKLP